MGNLDWVPPYLQPHLNSRNVLSKAEQIRLTVLAQKGDSNARETLIVHNIRFMISRVLKWKKINFKTINDDNYCSDLLTEAMIGLNRSIDSFDPSRGYVLITYARHWVDMRIRRRIIDDMALVKIGTTQDEKNALNSPANYPSQFRALKGRLLPYVPLDTMENEQENSCLLEFSLKQRALMSDKPSSEDQLIAEESDHNSKTHISRALSVLTPMEQDIIKIRFLSDDDHVPTLESLGGRFNVTRECVRQHEERALKKMARALGSHVHVKVIKAKMKKAG